MKKLLVLVALLAIVGLLIPGGETTLWAQTDSLTTAEPNSEVLPDLESREGVNLISIFRGLVGLLVLVGIGYLFSTDRKNISWKVVATGLIFQFILAIGVLQIGLVRSFFEFVGGLFVVVLNSTAAGTQFLFGEFMDSDRYGFIFALQVLPTILFFAAITSLLYYLGIIQLIVKGLAWVLSKAMKISGAESLSVAGNIFLGQTESPLLIKGYLPTMSNSEVMLVMTGGMATLAGGVLAAYISFLGGDDPVQRVLFAKHLLAASVMAAPGAVVMSKILVPQTKKVDQTIRITKDKIGSNVLDAISNGTGEGLRLMVNVGAMLLVFIAFIALFNFILDWIGSFGGVNEQVASLSNGQFENLSLEFLLGYLFAPVMWVIGVASEDITLVGRMLGEKLVLTEFIGYVTLSELKGAGAFAQSKSILMATYMLCGFANIASIGIQIGGIGSLAPNKRVLLSQFGMRALLAGTLASLLSATMVGIILG